MDDYNSSKKLTIKTQYQKLDRFNKSRSANTTKSATNFNTTKYRRNIVKVPTNRESVEREILRLSTKHTDRSSAQVLNKSKGIAPLVQALQDSFRFDQKRNSRSILGYEPK